MAPLTSFLFGRGAWSLWYTLLWAAAAPALILLVWLLRAPALAAQHPGSFSTLQGLAIVLHPLITPLSVIFFTVSRKHSGSMKYLQAVGLIALLWFFGFWFMFGAWWRIDALDTPRAQRTLSTFNMAATSLALHLFNLYAVWRFRAR